MLRSALTGTLALALGMTGARASFPQGMVVVAFGDSTTAPRSTIPRVYGQILQEKLPAALGRSVTVYNAGVGGHQTSDALARLDADVRTRHPHTVIVQFGINDSWVYSGGEGSPSAVPINAAAQAGHPHASLGNFADNLARIVDTLKADGARVILMTPNQLQTAGPGAEEPWRNQLLAKYAQVVRNVASAKRVSLVDVWKMYADYAAIPGHRIKDLLVDSQHPNQALHQMEADALLALITSARASPRPGRSPR